MEEFLEKLSHETLNDLRRMAQQSQDAKLGAVEMGDAEILKLVMMHMSKSYHEDEIEMFQD